MRKIRFLVLTVCLVAIVSFGFADVSYPYLTQYGPAIVNWGSNIKYSGTLTIGVSSGQLVDNFNPFFGITYGNTVGYELVYETLGYINGLNGSITPLLATSYKWIDNGLKLIVTTRKGVKWSDGIPFSAKDVAFTFNYIRTHPSLDGNGIWAPSNNLQSVEASGDNVVVFTFSKPNSSIFYYIYSGQFIVPEHVWSKIDNPTSYLNPDPIGTGPFVIKSFSAALNEYTLVKNPYFWIEGRPYIDKIVVKSYKSDSSVEMALLSGEIDYTITNILDVKRIWIDKDPSTNLIWWVPVSERILALNTQKYPFNIPTFRRALNLAISKEEINNKVYFGMAGIPDPTGMSPSQSTEWLDPTLKASMAEAMTYDPVKSQELLASIGFKKNSIGQLCDPNGKPLPTYTFLTNSGWLDGMTIGQITCNELKKIGLDVVMVPQSSGQYTQNLKLGHFDIAYTWENAGPTPYYAYFGDFYPTLSATEIGKPVISDYSRYTNPFITAALESYNSTTDLHLQKQAIYTIERIVLEDMPFIAITPRITTTEFSAAKFTGWPTTEYPYVGGNSDPMFIQFVALNLHLK